MASPDEQATRAGHLIERLLVDADFRASFRTNPVQACLEANLPELAEELSGSGKAMHTLELRESRSSLAGVVMAVAVEGIGIVEVQSLRQHGLAGDAPAAAHRALRGGNLEHRLRGAERQLERANPLPGAKQDPLGALPPDQSASQTGAPGGSGAAAQQPSGSPLAPSPASAAGAPGAPGAVGAGPGAGAAGAGAVGGAGASSSAGGIGAGAGAGAGAAGAGVTAAPGLLPQSPPAVGAAVGAQLAAPSSPLAAPPDPGAQPAQGGVAPVWPDASQPTPAGGGAGAGGALAGQSAPVAAPGGLSGLLESPRLALPPDARAVLAQGNGDPRLVSVLDSALANHTIGIGQMATIVDPVHAQSLDIVSVDGQPVGPENIAARDLITEIAALDPSVRPSEIGTPWPIRSQGFFTDAVHQNRLHLAFEMPPANSPPPAGADAVGPSVPPGGQPGLPAAAPGGQPGVPGAAPGGQVPGVAGAASGGQAAGVSPAPVPGQAGAGYPAPGARAPVAAGTPGASSVADVAGAGAAPGPHDPFYGSPKAHAALAAAKKELGVPYRWGGTSPKTGFDCSGLTQWAYNQVGIDLPRVAADQFHAGKPVDLQHLREGDLVFFQDSSGYIHHMGMYVGDHKFIQSPHTGDVVKYEDLRKPYWAHQFAGGRRIVPLGAPPTPAAGPEAAGPGAVAGSVGAGATPGLVPATPGEAGLAGPPPPVTPGESGLAGPPQPGTAAFKALQRQESSFHRHTVQFMQAIQPPPGSPFAAQAAAAPGGQVPFGAQPSAEAGAGGAAGQQVLDQAGAGAPGASAGSGAITVTSSKLTRGQQTFAARLAQLTGLDPRVIAAWELAEESGSAAQGRESARNYNWLNIAYFDSGAGQMTRDPAFHDPVTAADKTARFLKGTWGGASSGIRAILHSASRGAQQQISAIAGSGWASSGYNGGASLRGTFDALSDFQVHGRPSEPGAVSSPVRPL